MDGCRCSRSVLRSPVGIGTCGHLLTVPLPVHSVGLPCWPSALLPYSRWAHGSSCRSRLPPQWLRLSSQAILSVWRKRLRREDHKNGEVPILGGPSRASARWDWSPVSWSTRSSTTSFCNRSTPARTGSPAAMVCLRKSHCSDPGFSGTPGSRLLGHDSRPGEVGEFWRACRIGNQRWQPRSSLARGSHEPDAADLDCPHPTYFIPSGSSFTPRLYFHGPLPFCIWTVRLSVHNLRSFVREAQSIPAQELEGLLLRVGMASPTDVPDLFEGNAPS